VIDPRGTRPPTAPDDGPPDSPAAWFVDDAERRDADGLQAAGRDGASGPFASGVFTLGCALASLPREGNEGLLRMAADPRCLVVPLEPLPLATIERLVRSLVPLQNQTLDAIGSIARASAGSPAAAVEIVRALVDSGRIGYEGGAWVLRRPTQALPLPGDGAAARRERIERLPDSARLALLALGYLGNQVPRNAWGAIAAATRLSPEEQAALESRGFVVLGETNVKTTLPGAPPDSPAETGTEAADRAKAMSAAVHVALSEPGLDPAARLGVLLLADRLREARAAAGPCLEELRRRFRLDESMELARKLAGAGALAPEGEGSLDWALPAGLVATDLEFPEEARTFLAAASREDATTGPVREEAWLRLLELEAGRGRVTEDQVPPLPDAPEVRGPALRARLSLAQSQFIRGLPEEALSILHGVLEAAGEHTRIRVRALSGISAVLSRLGRIKESIDYIDRAIACAASLDDPELVPHLKGNRARLAVRDVRYRFAARMASDNSRHAGFRVSESHEIDLLLTTISAMEGLSRWRVVRVQSQRLLALVESGRSVARVSNARRRLGRALGMLGDHEGAIRTLTRSIQAGKSGEVPRELEGAYCALAGLHLERGEVDLARDRLGEAPAGEKGFSIASLLARCGDPADPTTLSDVRSALAATDARAFPEELLELRLHEVLCLHATDSSTDALEAHARLLRDARRAGSSDVVAKALALSGTIHAIGDPHARTGMYRAARLARRLHSVLVRASVLEQCGRYFLEEERDLEFGRNCLREAVALFGAASLPHRAEALTDMDRTVSSPRDWRGLRPEKLAWVLDQTESINQIDEPEGVLAALLDAAIRFTGAERGFLVLATPPGFAIHSARSMEGEDLADGVESLSVSLVKRCLQEGASLATANAREDGRFAGYFSVRDLQLRSILVVPLKRGDRVLGAFYLDNRFLESVFSDQDQMALERLASQAALAFENVRYRAEVKDLAARLQEKVAAQSTEIEDIRTTVKSLQKESRYAYEEIIRDTGPMSETLRIVDRAVESHLPVLLEGESGTGKELVARAIHFHGPLRDKPFVVVNCAAFPESLIDSELFGHVKGAFTGAIAARQGVFVEADGGTLFLDEVGEIPLGIQAKLLRALQFGEVMPVGGSGNRKVEVRVVAATNRDLRRMLAEGKFLEDLFYRLAVLPIRLPTLRERRPEIPTLAGAILRRVSAEAGRGPRRLSRQAIARLLQHDWPGNIRELENVLRQAVLTSPGDIVQPQDLPALTAEVRRSHSLVDRIRTRWKGKLRPREEIAVRWAAEKGRITFKEFVGAAQTSGSTATRDLRRLVSLKVLVRRGRTAAAHYEIAPGLAADENVTTDGDSVT
jgi:transcriptional regulator with GAF, ATPase, and Fis domain/tetratricopeptide (TPR) repeat protein